MPPGDVPLPDSLVPGNGAVRPTLNTSGYGGSYQKQTPTSPADSNVPFDSPRALSAGGRNGSANSPIDGGYSPVTPVTRDPTTPHDQLGYWDRPAPRENSRSNGRSHTKSPGSTTRICKKCGDPLTGQFVRALSATYHLECFKCEVSLQSPFHAHLGLKQLTPTRRTVAKSWHRSSSPSTRKTEVDNIPSVKQITFADWTFSAMSVVALCADRTSPH